MSSPLLFGPNNTSKNLQNAILLNNGNILDSNGASNFLPWNSFEGNTTTGWSLFNTTMSGVTPTGSISAGATSITTFATTGTNPLSNTYSLNLAASSAFTAGQGLISDAFTIPNGSLASVLQWAFQTSVVSGGSNLNLSGTSSNTFAIWFYDVTASAWLQPAGVWNMVTLTGPGRSSGTMQTSIVAGQQYRIALLCINSSAGAASLLVDKFYVGPQITPQGFAGSDWQAYTPTITGLPTSTASGRWRRVGDSMEVYAYGLASGAATAQIQISIPSGLSIDQTKTARGSFQHVGTGQAFSTSDWVGQAFVNSSTTISVAGPNGVVPWQGTTPFTWASGNVIQLHVVVPISGWSSNTVMSADTDTRVVALNCNNVTSGSLPNTYSGITYTVVKDTHAAYSGSIYTVPVSGWYNIQAALQIQGGSASVGNTSQLAIFIGGTETFTDRVDAASTSILIYDLQVSGLKYLNAGNTIQIQAFSAMPSAVVNASSVNAYLNIQRLSGPATIAASESVTLKYTSASATTTVAASSVPTLITCYDTKVNDSHNAFNTSTSTFTAPISGNYRYSITLLWASGSHAIGDELYPVIYKNGSSVERVGYIPFSASGTYNWMSIGTSTIPLNAGDTLQWYGINTKAATQATQAAASISYFSIERIGN